MKAQGIIMILGMDVIVSRAEYKSILLRFLSIYL